MVGIVAAFVVAAALPDSAAGRSLALLLVAMTALLILYATRVSVSRSRSRVLLSSD